MSLFVLLNHWVIRHQCGFGDLRYSSGILLSTPSGSVFEWRYPSVNFWSFQQFTLWRRSWHQHRFTKHIAASTRPAHCTRDNYRSWGCAKGFVMCSNKTCVSPPRNLLWSAVYGLSCYLHPMLSFDSRLFHSINFCEIVYYALLTRSCFLKCLGSAVGAIGCPLASSLL